MAAVFDGLEKLELDLESVQISELQRRVTTAEMVVKERELRIKDLRDMMLVTEAEKDGKMRDIEKLEVRLQEVMVSVRDKQEELHAMHLAKSKTTGNSNEVSQEIREQLEKMMNGNKEAGADANEDKKEEVEEMESVEVSYPLRAHGKMSFRITQNLDFHTLLIAAVKFFRLQTEEMSDHDIDEAFRLVGPQRRAWPLKERVSEYLRSQGGADWFIAVEAIEEVVDEKVEDDESEESESEEEEENPDTKGILYYPPKVSRLQIVRELAMFITFVVLFVLVLFGRRTIQQHQFLYQAHREALIEEEFGDQNILQYHDIATWSEFWDWVEGPLTEGLFPYIDGEDGSVGAPATELLLYNKLVGGVRFNQNRVQNHTFDDCGLANKKLYTRRNNATGEVDHFFDYCYPMYDGGANRDTSDFGPGATEFGFFYQRSNHTFRISGDFGSYDNSGYMYDMDDLDPSGAGWLKAVDTLKSNRWLDKQTRAIQIDFVTYNANFDLYTCVFFLVEFTASGFCNPHFVIETFSMSLWRAWQRAHPTTTTILELIICVFILWYAREEFKEFKMARKITGSVFPYFKQIWNVVDLMIIGCYFATAATRLWFFFEPRRWDFNPFKRGYVEFYDIARLYNNAFELDSGVVLLLSFKLFKYFQLSKSTGMLWETLKTAGPSIAYFLFMFVIILAGFSLMGTSLFGSVLFEYSTFARSLETLLLMLLGDFDYDRLQAVDDFWAPFFFAFYMVLVVFVLLNIFLAILNEAYGTESAKLQEELMLGGKKNANKVRMIMKMVKQNLKDRKRDKELARAEEAAYMQELEDHEKQLEESRKKAMALRKVTSGVGKGIGRLGKGVGAVGKGVGKGVGAVGKGVGKGVGKVTKKK